METAASKLESAKRDEIRKIFRLSQKLPEMGTEEQYSEYLQTIFPESEVRSIVWHGSPNERFDAFDEQRIGQLDAGYYGRGFSFTENVRFANQYRTRYRGQLPTDRIEQGSIYPCIINLKKPFRWNDKYQYFMPSWNADPTKIVEQFSPETKAELLKRYNQKFGTAKTALNRDEFEYADELGGLAEIGTDLLKEKGFDGSIATNPLSGLPEFLVFSALQIHILGSESDIEKFQQFIKTKR